MANKGGVSREHAKSTPPKFTFAALHALTLAVCVWLVFGNSLTLPDRTRALLLLGCAALYFLRHLVTLFVLLKRKVSFSEGLGLAAFIAVFEIGFLLLGGGFLSGAAHPVGALDGIGMGLVLIGSVLNSGAELQRWAWKRDPANTGHLYTGGLFRASMHINYFGDTLLFTGWAVLTGYGLALLLPVFMAASFIWVHIPGLDAYLAGRYGDEFRAYAARTAKFVPFLY